MVIWSIAFLLVAIVAALLALSGLAGAATLFAYIVFIVGFILAFACLFFRGKKRTSIVAPRMDKV